MSTVLDPVVTPRSSRKLLTIEEYAGLPDDGRLTELVRGEVVEVSRPKLRHGQVSNRTGFILTAFCDANDRGHVVTNDTGIITERDPDTLRGADVAFYSYGRIPKGPLPNEYPQIAPEVAFEVKSPDDRWRDIHEKISEYLKAGVVAVVVLDADKTEAHVFTADGPRKFAAHEILELPEPLADFRVEVRRFFE